METGRRPLRLSGHDYSQPGLYFITVCTHRRQPILGDVADGEVELSLVGTAVQVSWEQLPHRVPGVELDTYVIMPNHIHGILMLGGNPNVPVDTPTTTIPMVLRTFKSISGIAGNRVLGRLGQPFWQRGYHDRVIRSDRELEMIRRYIADNPGRWEMDGEYPLR